MDVSDLICMFDWFYIRVGEIGYSWPRQHVECVIHLCESISVSVGHLSLFNTKNDGGRGTTPGRILLLIAESWLAG